MDTSTLTSATWTLLFAAAFLQGLSKGGMPGVSILAIPLVAMVIPGKAASGLILPMLILGDLFAVAIYRRHAVWRHLLRLIPCAIVGVIAGWLVLERVDDRQLRPLIGAIVLAMIALNWWRMRRMGGDMRVPQGWWFPLLMGLAAGATTMMANAAGPIMVIYLLAMRLPKMEYMGTGAIFYLLMNLFKVPFMAQLGLVNGPSLGLNLWLAPAVLAGALLGKRLLHRIDQKPFEQLALGLAALAGLKLLC